MLNPHRFRRIQARRLGLGALARLAWAKERRVCQAVRAELPDGRRAVLANLHATSYPADKRLPDAELLRGAAFADGLAEPGELCVFAGDFNVRREESWTLRELVKPEWGFSNPGPGIDHVLVRGAPSSPERRWPEARRRRRASAPVRPCTRGGGDRMTFEDVRAQFPVLERWAYLNAGTNGPLARATLEAVEEKLSAEARDGRGGGPYFERMLALRDETRAALSGVFGAPVETWRSSTRPPTRATSSSPGSISAPTTRS